ncbi:hypothetical protein [Halovivax gelatinilyticus]|uniref:hypothetical protein n=1 Tax=Halovivax gelatinilyticus TaxID=2961597 RepID=UPI0020CA31F3|nr:hypothetical protein [Halovivax gelatinilyticus]
MDDCGCVRCDVELSEELLAELDTYCRDEYLHREAAVTELLDDWLAQRTAES